MFCKNSGIQLKTVLTILAGLICVNQSAEAQLVPHYEGKSTVTIDSSSHIEFESGSSVDSSLFSTCIEMSRKGPGGVTSISQTFGENQTETINFPEGGSSSCSFSTMATGFPGLGIATTTTRCEDRPAQISRHPSHQCTNIFRPRQGDIGGNTVSGYSRTTYQTTQEIVLQNRSSERACVVDKVIITPIAPKHAEGAVVFGTPQWIPAGGRVRFKYDGSDKSGFARQMLKNVDAIEWVVEFPYSDKCPGFR